MVDKDKYKDIALGILSPIKQVDKNTIAKNDFLFSARRSDAGRNLPEYYFVYFLFADLLGFENLGQFEKIAWSFPIDYNGKAFLIEYRKFGVGVFVQDKEEDETAAKEITQKIIRTVNSIKPFYDSIAEEAIKKSEFNILNTSAKLWRRFEFLLKLYKKEKIKVSRPREVKSRVSKSSFIRHYYQQENPKHAALSCIEAFYSWTEHLFIHLAVVANNLSDGEKIKILVGAEWKDKFKAAIIDDSSETKKFYDDLLIVRKQLRNYVAHGAFGKDGSAFRFHSQTGTVPVIMDHNKTKNQLSLHRGLMFKEDAVIQLIEEFVKYLWNGSLKPAMHYIQKKELPTILTLASDGTYRKATKDMKSMKKLVNDLSRRIENSANMDW